MLRLSVCYALLDKSKVIELPHLKAAKAMWDYAEGSAKWLFGERIGDEVADKLLTALRRAGDDGLDSTQQYQLLGRHIKQARLDVARNSLEAMGLITTSTEPTGGRPRGTTYIVRDPANEAKEANQGSNDEVTEPKPKPKPRAKKAKEAKKSR
jgi:hypothetical protein